jgi:signal transduction histidine kinase
VFCIAERHGSEAARASRASISPFRLQLTKNYADACVSPVSQDRLVAEIEPAPDPVGWPSMNGDLKEIAAAVAHDLNNYLQVVMGNLELLRRRREFAPETVEAALGATRNCAALADRLLTLGRLQPPAPRAFDLNHFVREFMDTIAHTLGAALQLELDLARDLPSALADPRAVQLALLELAANAQAAMSGGGRLMVRTAPGPQGFLVLEVADTGDGMSPATLARAQAPLLSRGERGKPGGLGLPIVEACIRQAGGRVELASAPGAGTTVKLYLPSA